MSVIKVNNTDYSIASQKYDRFSQAIDKVQKLDDVRVNDSVLINHKQNSEVGGVEMLVGNVKHANDVLSSGDSITIKSEKSNKFFGFIQEQLKKISALEKVTTNAVDQEAPLIELVESVNQAEMRLQETIQVRDKLVSSLNELFRMSF
jgi:flagellar hook-basal body complex protein FliE